MSKRAKVSWNGASTRERSLGKSLAVVMEHTPAPDAQERLRRAFDLILRAAARGEEDAHTKPTDGQKEVRDDG